MLLYPEAAKNEVCWPEPLESTYQLLGGGAATELAPKLPHLGLADVLFMTLVMLLPRERRPWGMVTWMAITFGLSRPGLYALTRRTQERLMRPEATLLAALPDKQREGAIVVSPERLVRTALTAAFPGKVALRPMQQILEAAFDQSPSVGWLSERLTEAGERAGQVLSQIDTSPLGTVIVARDETFFDEYPLLLVIDPVSSTILQAKVAPDRQAETWGIVLLMVQGQGATLGGVVEDMARMYDHSLREAELELDVQKDTWHIERDGAKLQRELERAALKASGQVMELEKKLLRAWDEQLFDEKYIPAVAKEERLCAQHSAFSLWLSHLYDALEVVDLRSGEIRDRATNGWLLEECLSAFEQIAHEGVSRWVRSLRRHQEQLLTCLDWLSAALIPFEEALTQALPDEQGRRHFIALVARTWRLQQSLINGHPTFTSRTRQSESTLAALCADSPALTDFAHRLRQILDGALRASSLIENINGLLKQFLLNRRSFRNAQTLQHYLDLFTLWHNMRVYERGKRQGKSPYQLAGIQTPSDDWLTLLGYPPAA